MEEVAEKYRPIMEFDKNIYELDEEDALDMAEAMEEKFGTEGSKSGALPLENSSTTTTKQGLVFGSDDRAYWETADQYPDTTIAATPTNAQTSARCTAFKMINHQTAITAAHCVYESGSGWRTRKSWQFAADGSNTRQPLNSGCYGIVIPKAFTYNEHVRYDYAVLRLAGEKPWYEQEKYNVGYLGWRYGYSWNDKTSKIEGYPADPLEYGFNSYPDFVTEGGDSNTVATFPNQVRTKIDATDGQSGSPFLIYSEAFNDYSRVAAVWKGSINFGIFKRNFGRKFDGGVIKFMQQFAGHP